jgi:hypothetical protein
MCPSKKVPADPEPAVKAPIPDPLEASSDEFPSLDDLRLPQNFGGLAGVKKAHLTIPVRKPRPQSFVRVRHDETPDLETPLLTLKEDREEVFLVDPQLWPELQAEIVPHVLAVAIDRQNNLFVWPLKVPAQDGRSNTWHVSALQAAAYAKKHWIRVSANMGQGAYDTYEAMGHLPDPEWPALTTREILRIAFKDKYITSLDHPVLRRLRGEV